MRKHPYTKGLEGKNMTKNNDTMDNIEFIQHLNRLILEEAEKSITDGLPLDNKLSVEDSKKQEEAIGKCSSVAEKERLSVRNAILHRLARMFGKNRGVVDVLEKLADTELKIDKQRPAAPREDHKPVPMDDRDIALVMDFVRKQKSSDH
jgi:hypothetical protein